jgi:putative peptide zinc metalloprotease protein
MRVKMNLSLQSLIKLVPINIQKDKKHFIVEDKNSGEFYEMPEICIEAIHLMNDGMALGEIEQFLKGKYPDEEVDLLDFAKQLMELQLIAEIDGVKIDIHEKGKEEHGFQWVSPKLGKFFFNQVSLVVYSIFFVGIILMFILEPSLFPHYKDLFIFHLLAFNIPGWLILSFILVMIHEFGHILAVRSFNLPTKLGIGHRLFLVVLETDMSSVWKLPSKDRNVLFLAGLCFDTTMLFFVLLAQLIFADGPFIFLGFIRLAALDIFIRMIYQCCFYMKTDIYYVIENLTGCYNLMENAEQVIRNKLPFIKSVGQNEVVFDEEKRTVHMYALFYFIGVGLTLLLFFGYFIPQVVTALTTIDHCFSYGPSSYHFWNAVFSTLQLLIGLLLLLYSLRKKYILKRF